MKATTLALLVLFVLIGTNAIAQETPEWEIGGDYSFVHFNPAKAYINNPHDLNGGGASFVYNLNNWLGLKADLQGYGAAAWTVNIPEPLPVYPTHPIAGTPSTPVVNPLQAVATLPAGSYKASGDIFTYMFGPQFKYHGHRLQPFAHVLFGGASSGVWSNLLKNADISTTTNKSVSGFAMTVGGGLDYNVNRHVGIRLFECDYLQTRFNPPLLATLGGIDNQNSFRFAAGVVFNLGTLRSGK